MLNLQEIHLHQLLTAYLHKCACGSREKEFVRNTINNDYIIVCSNCSVFIEVPFNIFNPLKSLDVYNKELEIYRGALI